MNQHRIYLSGPICGLTLIEATQWRQEVNDELSEFAEILDPMRDVSSPTDDTIITTTGGSQSTADVSFNNDRGIVARDYADTMSATLLIVNLLGAHRASIGTIAEIAWAYEKRILTIVVMEPSGNIHEHPFVREMTSYRVDTIERAIEVARSLMGVPAGW